MQHAWTRPYYHGSTIACAMELFEKGYIREEDLSGEELKFGDALSIMKLTEKQVTGKDSATSWP